MRITLTVWRQSDTLRIALTSKNDESSTHFVIEEDQSGKISRVISKDEAERLYILLDEKTLPIIPKPTKHGGDTYMLHLENGFNSVTYNWCTEPPEGWEKLGELSGMLVEWAGK